MLIKITFLMLGIARIKDSIEIRSPSFLAINLIGLITLNNLRTLNELRSTSVSIDIREKVTTIKSIIFSFYLK
jgi:hypothetical protein